MDLPVRNMTILAVGFGTLVFYGPIANCWRRVNGPFLYDHLSLIVDPIVFDGYLYFAPKLPTGAGHRLDHLPGRLGPLVATDIGLGGNLFFSAFWSD